MQTKTEVNRIRDLSRKLCYLLRHDKGTIGNSLNREGWCDIAFLLKYFESQKESLDISTLLKIFDEDEKKRYEISKDQKSIRTSQGHSNPSVFILRDSIQPPDVLYHGTTTRFLDSISKNGIISLGRHDVHLSDDFDTAISVGSRHGPPVVLSVDAIGLFRNGKTFTRSSNGVWLTDFVPASSISSIEIILRESALAAPTSDIKKRRRP